MWRGPISWSPVEVDFLKENRHTRSIMQLTICLAKSRNAIKRKCDELDGKAPPKKKNKHSRIGKREDIVQGGKAQFFRSSWEANYCRYMNAKGRDWEYEPQVFYFEGVKSGTMSYCPDFKYGKTGLWLEIKGQLTAQGRTAINRFRKYYPAEFKKLRAVVGRPNTVADKFFKKLGVPVIGYMNELDKKYSKTLEHWE